jgi:ferredoxin
MITTIYYFSSTGNSLQIARIIAREIENCSITPITETSVNESVGGTGRSIGFTFPVFNFGMPRLVRKFIENLKILPDTYCFAFICYGGYGANTLGMLEDILAGKNPIRNHNCQRCLRCVQWCPNEAVQYGRKTLKWRRYHNPGIKRDDLLIK